MPWTPDPLGDLLLVYGKPDESGYVFSIVELNRESITTMTATWDSHELPTEAMTEALDATMLELHTDPDLKGREFVFYFDCMVPGCEPKHAASSLDVADFIANLREDRDEALHASVWEEWVESLHD